MRTTAEFIAFCTGFAAFGVAAGLADLLALFGAAMYLTDPRLDALLISDTTVFLAPVLGPIWLGCVTFLVLRPLQEETRAFFGRAAAIGCGFATLAMLGAVGIAAVW